MNYSEIQSFVEQDAPGREHRLEALTPVDRAAYLCLNDPAVKTHGEGAFDRFRDAIAPDMLRLTNENDALRAIAAKIMPCHYCGAADIAKCPRGFPGCALADDLLCGEQSMCTEILRLREVSKAKDDRLREIVGHTMACAHGEPESRVWEAINSPETAKALSVR